MAYLSQDNSLYFTQPSNHVLQKMDMRTQQIIPVLSGNSLVPSPMALCLSNGKLFVADQSLPTVYQVEWESNSLPSQAPISLIETGTGDHIRALAETNGNLYALQSGATPLAQVYPSPRAVNSASPWGFLLPNDNPQDHPFPGI